MRWFQSSQRDIAGVDYEAVLIGEDFGRKTLAAEVHCSLC